MTQLLSSIKVFHFTSMFVIKLIIIYVLDIQDHTTTIIDQGILFHLTLMYIIKLIVNMC